MISPARRFAFEILRKIESGGIFSDDAINSHAISKIEPRDRNLTTEIVYGTLRWQLLLDHVLSKGVARPWSEVDVDIRILLRMSLYQMWHLDRIPDHALVDDAVELAKRKPAGMGVCGFVNGVLRSLSRTRPWQQAEFESQIPPWVRASLPRWLWERWTARFGEERAQEYAISLNQPPRHCFRIRNGEQVARPAPESPRQSSDLVPGAYFCDGGSLAPGSSMQDEASQLIPHLLGLIPGGRIWDACASPGGKSAILSEKYGTSGLVVSSDLRWDRVKRLRRTLSGHSVVPLLLVADATKTAPFRVDLDAVLVDAPCSGLGTLRRNPEIKWRFRAERFYSLRQRQVSILQTVASAVRQGGMLLYSTCSTEPEEDEHVVDAFLESHGDFRLVRPVTPSGIDAWTDARGFVRTFPSTRIWDGFFAALMVRYC